MKDFLWKIIGKWIALGRKRRVYILSFSTLVFILLWAFVSAGIITHDFNRNVVSKSSDKQEATINGVILTETKDTTKFWEIYGETGSYDSTNAVAMLDNVIGNFYKDNEVSMSFQSSKGTYNTEKNIIILYQNTFIVLKDGTTLKADRLKYSGNNLPIVANGNIQISRGSEFLAFADEVDISPDFTSFKIKGHTTSKIFDRR